MSLNWFALFPEFFLVLTLIGSVFVRLFREKATPKTFYTLSKFGVAAAFIATLIFYNQSFWNGVYENSLHSSLFKVFIYLFAAVTMFLSAKYFLSKDYPSFRFYSFILLSLLFLTSALSAVDIRLMVVLLELGFLLNFYLIRSPGNDDETYPVSFNFFLYAFLWTIFMAFAVSYVVKIVGGGSFEDIAMYCNAHEINWQLYACGAIVLLGCLYKLGVAPFHFWTADVFGAAILPVGSYLMIVPVFAYYAAFVQLSVGPLAVHFDLLKPAFYAFSLISIFIGAIGANGEINLRRIMAYSRIFVLGIVLLLLSSITEISIFSSFIYLFVSMLALGGVFAACYALKNKGDYLRRLNELSGLAESKPFIAAAMLIFMVSLLGFPPLLGFLGMVFIVDNLVAYQDYVSIFVIMLGIVILAAAYLRVIKTFYFDVKRSNFDRADRGIYFMLLLILAVILVFVLSPKYLVNDVEMALRGLVS